MRRKAANLIIIILVPALLLTGCRPDQNNRYQKFSDSFFNTFDTLINITAYVQSEQEFNDYFEKAKARFEKLHRLFDIYNEYEGINNLRTVNKNAGIRPVKVDRELIDLILFAKEWYHNTEGRVNVAMGPVLEIWHRYRQQGLDDPSSAELPPGDELEEASRNTDIDRVIVDTDEGTVYLKDEGMSLDVGAVAKGFAVEIVVKELMEAGLESGIINAGGNIRIIGRPLDGIRERWGIGIQDPEKFIVSEDGDNLLDILYINDASVVSSGDYQRYYVVDDEIVHHLIDPDTLMPGVHNKAVTVVTGDSGLADILSTAVFLMPYEKGAAFVESLDGVEAIWVMRGGRVEVTDGLKKTLKSFGAAGAR
jgi:thiamine biosynthesis lipoprotein